MPKLTNAQITKLAARRKEIDKLLKELNTERDQISAKLLSLDPETVAKGNGVTLSFSPYRELDKGFIEKKFPPSSHPDYYKLTLDGEAFKKDFSPKELEAFKTLTYRISVKEDE